MSKYHVVVREVYYRLSEVEANSPEEAEEIALNVEGGFDELTYEGTDSVDVTEIA